MRAMPSVETLGQKQKRFARMVPRLIDKLHELGYECSLGDAFRDPRVHGQVGEKKGYGHSRSGHKNRLAIDLNLFKDSRYITDDEGHKELGAWWKAQGDDHAWGGDFQDPNHYSIAHEGVK
jgi:hypothetical protein